jgi:predicted amidophosphoribosyltransferase
MNPRWADLFRPLHTSMNKADLTLLWKFDAELVDNSQLECPGCHRPSPIALWSESEVYCEDCGEHAAIVCPICGETFDHVWGPTFHVLVAPQSP